MMSSPPIPLVRKLADWPDEDRRLWLRCLTPGGLFEVTNGAFAGWSQGTRRVHAQGYGSWLSHLERLRPDLIAAAPADRVTPETVSAFIEKGQTRLAPRSIVTQLTALASIIRGFAPDRNWAWLWRALDRFQAQSGPQVLKPPLPLTARDLFRWSLRQLERLSAAHMPHSRSTALAFRQALSVGLLISCPVRARAFTAMTVSRHLDLSSGRIILDFAPEDMKDRKARRLFVPEPLAPFLRAYLDTHRPLLLSEQTSDALWISLRGRPLSQDDFTKGLALLTQREFGRALRPHAFRHIAATSIATSDPAHAGIIRDILGHATVRMAEAHYNRATAREASQRLQAVLRSKRKQAPRKRPRRLRTPGEGEPE